MKNNCMTSEYQNCPHCSEKQGLRYYKESDGFDLYYCENCFGLVSWDGFNKRILSGEAYPNREGRKNQSGEEPYPKAR